MYRKFYSARRLDQVVALRHDADRIRHGLPGLRHESVGRCEHLDWPGDIEQLYRRIGEDFDNVATIWRKTWGFWHHRKKMPR